MLGSGPLLLGHAHPAVVAAAQRQAALGSTFFALNEPGIRRHIRLALAHGATPEEISEVLQLASAIAIHTCTLAVPGLMDADQAARVWGRGKPPAPDLTFRNRSVQAYQTPDPRAAR